MANVNKVILIGRLTRDPETRTFSNGGKVAKFGFAVTNRKKNSQTGQWEDVPMFIDCEAFNRGEFGKQADLVEQYLTKGRQVFIEGHLRLDSWEKDGQKRSRLVVVVDNVQFLDSKQDGSSGGDGTGARATRGSAPAAQRKSEPSYSNGGFDEAEPGPSSGNPEDDIPF